MDLGLKDKVVLITGASRGIGLATAKEFHKEGAKIAFVSKSFWTSRKLKETNEEFGVVGVDWNFYYSDVSEEAQISFDFNGVAELFGKINVCIANAGVACAAGVPIWKMDVERFDQVHAVNLRGAWLTAREFFRHLEKTRPEHASLIFVGSSAGTFGEAGASDYASSKGGLVSLMKTLAKEVVSIVPKGRVNLIAPGWTRTDMTKEFEANKEIVEREMKTRALRRIAEPEEIARQIVLLSSEEVSSAVTGAIVKVDCGMEGRIIHE